MTRDTAGDGTPIRPIPRLLADDVQQIDRAYGAQRAAAPVPPPLRGAPARTVPGHTVLPSAPTRRKQGPSLRVDWPACKGHGLCAELLPERFGLDEWRYPIVDPTPVPADLIEAAKRAVASCPTLALRLVDPPG